MDYSPVPGRPIFSRLTPRQREVAEMVMTGLSNKEIAVRSNTTESVVKNICFQIYDRVGCESRLQLAVILAEEKLKSFFV